jgi:hypothetical protein
MSESNCSSEWRDVQGAPGYRVNRSGQVIGLKGTILRPGKTSNGYFTVVLCYPGTGKKKRMTLIHRIVAEAFLGPCPHKWEVDHKNGIKTDNRVENLEYVTSSENTRRSFAMGLQTGKRGEENPLAKLTEENVKDIRALASTMMQKDIATMFGISKMAVCFIVNRKRWAHVA